MGQTFYTRSTFSLYAKSYSNTAKRRMSMRHELIFDMFRKELLRTGSTAVY